MYIFVVKPFREQSQKKIIDNKKFPHGQQIRKACIYSHEYGFNPKRKLRIQNIYRMKPDEKFELLKYITEVQLQVIERNRYILYVRECINTNQPILKQIEDFYHEPEPFVINPQSINLITFLN